MPDDAPPKPVSSIEESQVTTPIIETPTSGLPPVPPPTPEPPPTPPDPRVAAPPSLSTSPSETPEPVASRPASYRPAGFMQRAVAYFIDQVIVTLLYGIWLSAGLIGATGSGNGRALMSAVVSPDFARSVLWGGLFIFVGYFTFFHSYGGQTPGKMVLRLKVVTADGGDLSALRSFCRALGYFASSLFFGVGFFLALVPPRKRALHDLLTNSQVVFDTTPSSPI